MPAPKHDLSFNVAQLLREQIGALREYQFSGERLDLDESQVLEGVSGQVRFTRTASGVIADARASGTVAMECTRCLKPTVQPVSVRFFDEFHSRVEVNTGAPLPAPDEEDPFFISELHMLDLGEAIREYALTEMPMQALCTPDCKGLCPHCGVDRNLESCQCGEGEVDERLAALRALLN